MSMVNTLVPVALCAEEDMCSGATIRCISNGGSYMWHGVAVD